MSNKNPFEVKFHNEFTNLIENLLKIYQEDKVTCKTIKKCYLNYKNSCTRSEFIDRTINCMEPYIDSIKSHDESIFCAGEPVELLVGLNFKDLWSQPALKDDHKHLIWKYLTNMYILGCHYNQKQTDTIKKILNQIKFDQKLKSSVDKESTAQNVDKLLEEVGELVKQLFGTDSFIHELLRLDEVQVAMNEFMGNPINTFKSYIRNNGAKLKDLTVKLTDRVKTKISSGELNKEKMERDITRIMNLVNKLKTELSTDSRFSPMLKQIKQTFNIDLDNLVDLDGLFKQMGEKLEGISGISMDQLTKMTPQQGQEMFDKLINSNPIINETLTKLGGEEIVTALKECAHEMANTTFPSMDQNQNLDTSKLPDLNLDQLPQL